MSASFSPVTAHNDIAWDVLIDNIRAGKTILFLGSELFNRDNKRLEQQLAEVIGVGTNQNIQAYPDGLYLFRGSSDILSYSRIKGYFKQDFTELSPILDLIARIKFKIILSNTPDHQLLRAFKRQNLPHNFHFYYKRQPSPEIEPPAIDKPVLYNLLGDINVRESMILTYDDLYDYFESVMEHKSMPEILTEQIRDAYNYIFIGMPFERWHTQLLLRVLKQHVNKTTLKYAANFSYDSAIQTFCQDQFNITCVPTDIKGFVEELFKRCEAAKLTKDLPDTPPQYFVDKCLKMVAEDLLKEVLAELSDYLDSKNPTASEAIDFVINLSGRLANLERRVAKNLIAEAESLVERAKIREATLDFLNENKALLI
jgi:hypothetical protein